MSANNIDGITQTDVGVFWDYENVKVPNHYRTSEAVNAIRNAISSYGRVLEKRCYYDSKKLTEANTDRSTLDLCGFTLVDCPTRGRKETLDKKMIVDILGFAWERVGNKIPACVVLISSDGDYSYTLSKLRDIGVRTVVIHGMLNFAQILLDCCDEAISWHHVLFPPSDAVEAHVNLEAIATESADNSEPECFPRLQRCRVKYQLRLLRMEPSSCSATVFAPINSDVPLVAKMIPMFGLSTVQWEFPIVRSGGVGCIQESMQRRERALS
jgi:uncharacterized LabA/DUF88 family protein